MIDSVGSTTGIILSQPSNPLAVDPNPYIHPLYHTIQRTGGLVWIWRQPPKLQAGGSNPLPFAINTSR